MTEQEAFIKNLSNLLDEANITQRELAEKINVTEVTISRYLSGERSPRIEIITKLANYFRVSTDYLLGRVEINITHKIGVSEPNENHIAQVKRTYKIEDQQFHVGLSEEIEKTFTNEEKKEIREFAEFVINKRKTKK